MSTTTLDTTKTAPAPAAVPVRRTRRRGERGPLGTALLHGGLALASLIALAPVAWLCYLSLGPDKDDYLHPGGIAGKLTFSNYSFVLQHTGFLDWFKSTLIVAPRHHRDRCPRRRHHRLRGLPDALSRLQAADVGPAAHPGLPDRHLIVPMYEIFSELGLIDTYWALIAINCSTAVPYSAWLLKGYFDTIPFEIDEAGRVDGLSPFGTFFRLILPLARPGLAVAAFYTFITAVGEVAFATTFLLDDSKYTFAVGLQTFVSEHDAQWNYMAATAVLIAIPVTVFFYLVQKNLVTGLTAGGTKG
ncbi:ABC transporter permease [Streptomyces rubradiris]|uniref:ABC transporter permease n=1 Tax=Streptomyces rubradiris TaxID=285531 RepID=A0ABQ3R7Y3_STRRR|nr:ABC transporter permease [Streptomyces rubradiris]